MSERPNVVIPSPSPRHRDFVREFRPWWQQAEEKWWGKFVPDNVRYVFDPQWRERTWSIQAAHERKGIWKPVSWLFYFSMYAFAIGATVIQILAIGIPMTVLVIGVLIFSWMFKKAAEDV